MKKQKEILIKGLLYHRYNKSKSLWMNIKIGFCRLVGHQVGNELDRNCCQRCGLAYEEIYYKQERIKMEKAEAKERESYRFLESIISINPLYWTKLKREKHIGNTTKLVDTIIDKFFNSDGLEVLIIDHYDSADNNHRLLGIVIKRLITEHGLTKEQIFVTGRMGKSGSRSYNTIKLNYDISKDSRRQ